MLRKAGNRRGTFLTLAAAIVFSALVRVEAASFLKPFGTKQLGTDRGQFEYAQSLESDGRYRKALDAYQKVLDEFPSSPLAAEAQFRVAEMLEKTHHYYAAFNAYQAVLDGFPSFPKVNLILDRQFRIGNLFLQGKTISFLRLNPSGSYKRAINIFRKIISNAPFSDLAPKAQYNLGLAYMRRKQYIEASIEFEKIPIRYPKSEFIASSKYQLGVCAYRQAKSAPYDQEAAQEAINSLRQYVDEYPGDKNSEVAKEMLMELQGRKAAALYQIGRFYEERENPKASLIYLKEVTRDYPLTRYAQKARKIAKREERKLELVEAIRGAQDNLNDIERRILQQEESINNVKGKTQGRWRYLRYVFPKKLSPDEELIVAESQEKIQTLEGQRQIGNLDLEEKRELMRNRLRLLREETRVEKLEDEIRAAQVELQVAQNKLSEIGELPEAEPGVLETVAQEIAEKEGVVRQEEQRLDEMRSAIAALGDEVEGEEEHIRQSYGARREIVLAKLEGREVEVPVEMGKHWWWPFGRSAVPAEAEPVKRAMEKEQGVATPVARKLLWRLWPFGTGEGGGKVDVEAKCEELYKEARELLQQAEGKKAAKNWNEAFACYDRASVALMKLRKIWPEYRKDEVSRLLQGCRDGLNDVRTQRARQQYEELLADLEAALRKNPDDADALFSIGAVSYRYGRIERAIESYKRVVSIRPRDAAAYYNLGAAYKDKGDLKEAASAFRKVIDINPDDAKTYYSLGVVYRELGDYKKACQKFEEALNADSSFAPAYFSLGNVYQANLGEPRMAVLYWKKYLKLNPHDPQAASLREWIAQVEASDTGGETTGERKTGGEKRPGWKSWLKFWDRGAHAEEAEGKAG